MKPNHCLRCILPKQVICYRSVCLPTPLCHMYGWFPKFHSVFLGTKPWHDEILIVSPRLGGRNLNFNPGIETLVVEILIVSLDWGDAINFNPGIEILESRLWRACPAPGLFPMPGLCRLSGCFSMSIPLHPGLLSYVM